MKMKVLTLLCFFLIIGKASAQDAPKEKSWTAAAGITAYSQNSFVKGEHPWEINLRYKMKEHHVLRASVAFMNKKNEAMPSGKFSVDYVAEKLPISSGFSEMFGDKSKKMHGFSIGYDYDYRIWNKLSILAGMDGGFGIWKETEEYYHIGIAGFYRPNARAFNYGRFYDQYKTTLYNIKPLLGIRYRYGCLLGEFSLGPNIQFSNQTVKNDYKGWNSLITDDERGHNVDEDKSSNNDSSKDKATKVYFHYNLSFYLTF